MTFTVEYEQEGDGHWLAEVLGLLGVLAYGRAPEGAIAKAQALALLFSQTGLTRRRYLLTPALVYNAPARLPSGLSGRQSFARRRRLRRVAPHMGSNPPRRSFL